MTPVSWERLKEILAEALERDGAERDRFVAAACAGDSELFAEVRRLLSEQEHVGDFLSSPAITLSRSEEELLPVFQPEEVVAGRFRIVRFIARGGMGDVFEAEDLKLGERVALKTIRPHLEFGARMDHLKREIQAARRVTHPNVCRTFEAEIRYAALHGDLPTAAKLMNGGSNPGLVSLQWCISCATLAHSYELAGDLEAALRTLDKVNLNRMLTYVPNGYSNAAAWHRIQYDRGRLLGMLGRLREAEEIETGLRRDLRLADADHPILVRLNQSERRPFNIY